jgi:hypothetical protein
MKHTHSVISGRVVCGNNHSKVLNMTDLPSTLESAVTSAIIRKKAATTSGNHTQMRTLFLLQSRISIIAMRHPSEPWEARDPLLRHSRKNTLQQRRAHEHVVRSGFCSLCMSSQRATANIPVQTHLTTRIHAGNLHICVYVFYSPAVCRRNARKATQTQPHSICPQTNQRLHMSACTRISERPCPSAHTEKNKHSHKHAHQLASTHTHTHTCSCTHAHTHALTHSS